MDSDTNLGSQSCNKIGGSSHCQHVFFRMKNLHVSMDLEKLIQIGDLSLSTILS